MERSTSRGRIDRFRSESHRDLLTIPPVRPHDSQGLTHSSETKFFMSIGAPQNGMIRVNGEEERKEREQIHSAHNTSRHKRVEYPDEPSRLQQPLNLPILRRARIDDGTDIPHTSLLTCETYGVEGVAVPAFATSRKEIRRLDIFREKIVIQQDRRKKDLPGLCNRHP